MPRVLRHHSGMQDSLDAMQTTLRVLTAITERRAPDPADMTRLRELAGPGHAQTEPDELACAVIQIAVKHREQVRRMNA